VNCLQSFRVGLVGLGSVAQVVHLPVLDGLTSRFEVVAACDVSLPFAEAVAARHGIPSVYASADAMIEHERLDIVAVLNSDEYHADCTIAALRAGCHVLLEKPAALTQRELDGMVAARDAAGRHVMVGYMRRHASAYAKLKAELAAAAPISHVAVRDIIGPNDYFIGQTSDVIVAGEIAPAVREDKSARASRAIAESLGTATPSQARAFRLLGSLSSHDFSALRGLVGQPRRVIAAHSSSDGKFISALFDFGSFVATFETGVDGVGVFDASIEIFTGDRRFNLQYDTPYIRHLPTRLTTVSRAGDELLRVESRPSYRDPYTNQWLRFHETLTGGAAFEETLEDAAHDLALAIEIAQRL
jgi:predicted dehydrogenase